jgi:hypothetical protein
MPFSLTDVLLGGVAPAIVAGVVLVLLRRFLPSELADRFAATVAVLSGFLTGYELLGLAPWMPTTHWHWLPYAMLGAAVIGPVAEGGGAFKRVFSHMVMAVAAAWMLVPTWDDLDPSRTIYLVVIVVYVIGLASLLEPLVKRFPGPLLPAILWATMTTAAVVLALSGSLRFAQITLAGAAALFGLMLVACLKRDVNMLTGISSVFSVMAVGSLLIGRVNSFSEVPLASYMLVPVAPLLLWVCTTGPLSRLTSVKRSFVYASLPIVLLVGSVLLAAVAEFG